MSATGGGAKQKWLPQEVEQNGILLTTSQEERNLEWGMGPHTN